MYVELDETNNIIKINNIYEIKMVGTFQDPYFCVKDSCRVFGSSNIDKVRIRHLKMLKEFNKDERSLGHTHFQNQPDTTFYMNVLGLFILAETEEDQDAVFEDIFPTIRMRENEIIKERLINQLNEII